MQQQAVDELFCTFVDVSGNELNGCYSLRMIEALRGRPVSVGLPGWAVEVGWSI